MIQAVKNGQFSAEYAYLYFAIINSGIISQWLHAFDRHGINGLLSKPKGRPPMKPQYPKMLLQKTEEERLRYRILELKMKCYFTERFETFEQLEQTILDDIHYYNHKRIQEKIKRTEPCGVQNSVLELNLSNFLGSDHLRAF